MPASPEAARPALERLARGWGLGGPALRIEAGEDLHAPSLVRRLEPALLRLDPAWLAEPWRPDDGSAAPAALAHALAHLRHGGDPWPRAGLKPVQQALLATFEDARVEALMLHTLPGLASLWWPAQPDPPELAGTGFEALLARLARALACPDRPDPHPWVHQAVTAFREAGRGRAQGLPTPTDLRALASRLGNAVGQMRLPFNPRTWRPWPAWRDDHLHLWAPAPEDRPQAVPVAPPPASGASAGGASAAPPADAVPHMAPWPAGQPVRRRTWPEWDRLIRRERPAWCTVEEGRLRLPAVPSSVDVPPGEARRAAVPLHEALPPWPAAWRVWRRHLLAARLPPRRESGPARGPRAAQGEQWLPDALLEAGVARRAGLPPPQRPWRAPRHLRPWPPWVLVLDRSVSTAAPGPQGRPWCAWLDALVLDLCRQAQARGQTWTLWVTASDTRDRVRMWRLRGPVPLPALAAALADWAPAWSDRPGTALRHAAAVDAGWLVRLGDGGAHDVDVHDPRYLPADLARVRAALGAAGRTVLTLPVP